MATGDDRDRVMETLLSRVLSRGQAAAAPCVDAETLAAWADHSLPASAAAQVESHVSSCSNCQAVMAVFARTAPEPAAAESLWHKWRLGWLVPLTGAAAALAIYVASRPPAREATVLFESEQAQVQRPAEALAAPGPAPKETAAPQEPVPAAPPASVLDERRADAGATAGVSPPPSAPAASGAVAAPQQNAARDQLAREEQPQAQPAQAPSAKTAVAAEAAAPAAPPPAAPAPARPTAAAARSLAFAPSLEVAVNGGSERWRIAFDGTVSRSTDAGGTFQPVATRVSVGIRAGSSPAAGVCWLVGDNGAVWLTTDGTSFRRLSFPEPVTLTAVTATSARAATVTAVDGRTLATTDQAASWQVR